MTDNQPIRLAEEGRLTLGNVAVFPATRTLSVESRAATIEPRVMQLLVTLARRPGEVVGREALIDACWDGRTVGEDAINRAVLKLRRALDQVGGDVTVETVAKVGYRLRIPVMAPLAATFHTRKRVPWWLAIGGAIATLAIIAGLVIGSRGAQDRQRIIFVQPLRVSPSDPQARRLAQDFISDLSRVVLGHDGALEFAEAGGGQQRTAAFSVAGSVASLGNELHAVISVSGSDDHTIIWSHDFTAPLDAVASLRQQVSTNVAAVLVCALGTRGLPDAIDARTTALYLEACNLHSGDQRQAAYLLRQVTARAPLFAGGWADLAISSAFASNDASGAEAVALKGTAQEAARRALNLDAHQGNAYYARALLLPGIANWVERERIITAGLVAQPDNPQLYNRLAIDLDAIGRQRDAIASNRRAVALDPLFPGKAARLVHSLANAGDLGDANEAIEHMRATWPDNPYTWTARFETAARIGDPREAEAMLIDPHAPPSIKPDTAAWMIFLRARAIPTRDNVNHAVVALTQEARNGALSGAQLVSDLTALGRQEAAMNIALHLPAQTESEFWFRSTLKPLRADPRFMAIAREQGQYAVWRATGLWPDFCGDRSLPYDCRKG